MYHVTTHVVANSWMFLEDSDYEARLAILSDAAMKGRMQFHSYCLMGNHEHLLISVEEDQIARLMQSVNRAYAGSFNQAHRRRGRFYRAPYDAVPVLSERHLLEVIRYIALNPELVGLGRAESYRWSSYPALVGVVRPIPFIDPMPLYDAVGGGDVARQNILELVNDGRLRKRAA